MHITCEHGSLYNAVRILETALGDMDSDAGFIAASVENGRLLLRAMDSTVSADCYVETVSNVDWPEGKEVLIEGHRLVQLVKASDEYDVTLGVEDGLLLLSCHRLQSRLRLGDGGVKRQRSMGEGSCWEVRRSVLRHALEFSRVFAVAGTQVIELGSLGMCAGQTAKVCLAQHVDLQQLSCTIHVSACKPLLVLLGSIPDETVTVSVFSDSLLVKSLDVSLAVSRSSVSFMDMSQMVDDAEMTATPYVDYVSRSALVAAMKRMAISADGDEGVVRLLPKSGMLEVSVLSDDGRTAAEGVEAEVADSISPVVCRCTDVVKALSAFKGDGLRLRANDHLLWVSGKEVDTELNVYVARLQD